MRVCVWGQISEPTGLILTAQGLLFLFLCIFSKKYLLLYISFLLYYSHFLILYFQNFWFSFTLNSMTKVVFTPLKQNKILFNLKKEWW